VPGTIEDEGSDHNAHDDLEDMHVSPSQGSSEQPERRTIGSTHE
jgi:hypothetical protein